MAARQRAPRLICLQHLIDRGTQGAVFEPNSERLWGERLVHDRRLLLTERLNSALSGERPGNA
jgi:hypothetical protein